MQKKVSIEICTGTTCFVMGAGHLLDLEAMLPETLRELTQITGAHCLGLCRGTEHGSPPFVRVNGRLLTNATVDAIIEACEEALRTGGAQ